MNQDSQDELDRIIRNYRDAWHRALRKADLAERESTIRHAEKDADRAEKYIRDAINAHTQKAVTEAKYEAIRNHYDAKYLAQVVNDYLDIRKQELNDLEATLTNQDRSTE